MAVQNNFNKSESQTACQEVGKITFTAFFIFFEFGIFPENVEQLFEVCEQKTNDFQENEKSVIIVDLIVTAAANLATTN